MTDRPEDANGTSRPSGDGSAEPVSHHQIRQEREEAVEEAQARRSTGDAPASDQRADGYGHADAGWRPPEEAAPEGSAGRWLLRVLLFAVVLAVVWIGGRWLLGTTFGPEIEPVRAVFPSGMQVTDAPIRAGVLMRNAGASDGSAVVVAVLPDGSEVEGTSVPVPAGDSVLAPVTLRLGSGDHTIALVAFDDTEEVRRLGSFPGNVVRVRDEVVVVEDVALPESVSAGEPLQVTFEMRNLGSDAVEIRGVVSLVPESGGTAAARAEGEPGLLPPRTPLSGAVSVPTSGLAPGLYRVEVTVLGSGERRLGGRSVLSPVRVVR